MRINNENDNKAVGTPVPYGAKFGQFTSKYEIPEGAVIMSAREMNELVFRTITKWQPRSEMWSFTYGTSLIAGSAMISGIYFNAILRNKFKLRTFGPLLTFAPTAIIPCISTLMVQHALVTSKLFMREFDCPTCAQVRSGSLMVATGVVQPCILSLLACSIIARYRHTISLPPLSDMNLWKTYGKMLKPMKSPILGLFLLNVAMGIFVTEEQAKAVNKVHRRLNTGM